MFKSSHHRAVVWLAVFPLAIGLLVRGTLLPGAEEKAAKVETDAAGAKNEQSAKRRVTRRLPRYYRQVVTPEQRQAIYAIQEDYFPKIEKLRKELEALTAKRDAEVKAVLSPEQLKKVEQFAAEARARRVKQAAPPKSKGE